MISRETINQVREKTDIATLVESKGVALKRAGSHYVGLCPVHSERTPSFNVNPNSQTFRCFGCGISGDVIEFVKEVDGYNFTGAVEYLAELANIVIENSDGEDPDYQRKKDYIRCVGQASYFFRRQFAALPESHPAKQNLEGRNYLEVEGRETWLEDFGMGYAPDSYDALSKFLRKQEFTEEQIIDAGLAFRSDKTGKLIDRFRHRLLWEIRDIQGRPIGFSGRKLREEDNPKYLNTSQTILYNKSKVLYGLDLARKKMVDEKTCFVVEGAADVMANAAVGVTNTVASCGTSFGSEHAAIIRRLIDDFDSKDNGKFVFVFDGDAAGQKAAARVFFDIKPSIRDRAYVVPIESGDPVDMRVNEGDDALYKALTEKQIPITEFMIRRIMEKHNLKEAEGRSSFVNEAMQLISHIDEVAIYESYKRKISFLSGVSLELLSGNPAKPQAPEQDFTIPAMDPFGEEPEPEPDFTEIPPDEGHSEGEYGYVGEEPADPFGEPSQPSPKPATATPAVRNTALNRVSKKLVATMLQYPEQTFKFLLNEERIVTMFEDKSLQGMLIEAMNITGYDVAAQRKPVIRHSDLTEGNLALDLFHVELGTSEERVEDFLKRLISSMEKLARKKHNENLKAKVAMESAVEISEDLSLLAEMVSNRRKK